MAPTPTSSFDVLSGPIADHLLGAAASATTRAVGDPAHGVLVVVVRPESDDFQVIAGGGSGVIRASVSVATAAGNDRVWRDAPDLDTAECSIPSLPEIVAAAAAADGVSLAHVGCVRHEERVEAVAIWFETWHGVASPAERREILANLAAAAAAARDQAAERAAATASDAADTDGPVARTFDPTDPSLDPVTGLLGVEPFAELLVDYERDEAMLLLIDLDGFARVAEEWGDEVSDRVLRTVADRLVENCRARDRIGRIGHDRFAILFDEIDRSGVMQIAKRLLGVVSEPLPDDVGPAGVSATVALSHQVGLVDLDEMMESAEDALASGKRAGSGRLVLAA